MDIERSSLGAKTLPGHYFSSPEVYEHETRAIFRKEWICVGRASDIANAGDYFLHELDGESFILVRDEEGRVQGYFNVCCHRGARMCEEACGHFQSRIQCPYHAWSYDLQGNLTNAPNMASLEGFDCTDYALRTVPTVTWQGFVLINLDCSCAPFESKFTSILSRFDDWELEDLVSAHRVSYEVAANWKIVFQNYSECYHCANVHPQLNPVTSVRSASNDFVSGAFLGGPMILSDAYQTISTSGAFCGELFPRLSEADQRRVYFYTLFPSLFVSPHPDYVLTHRIERRCSSVTRVICDWLFPRDIINRSGFDATNAVEFWDVTNRQDWAVCELTQLGVQSSAYRPGPYSNLESVLAAFDRHYLGALENRPSD